MINRKAKPTADRFSGGPTIRIDGELYSWNDVDPERASAYESLHYAADRANRLARELQREADKHVESTRRDWEDRK